MLNIDPCIKALSTFCLKFNTTFHVLKSQQSLTKRVDIFLCDQTFLGYCWQRSTTWRESSFVKESIAITLLDYLDNCVLGYLYVVLYCFKYLIHYFVLFVWIFIYLFFDRHGILFVSLIGVYNWYIISYVFMFSLATFRINWKIRVGTPCAQSIVECKLHQLDHQLWTCSYG